MLWRVQFRSHFFFFLVRRNDSRWPPTNFGGDFGERVYVPMGTFDEDALESSFPNFEQNPPGTDFHRIVWGPFFEEFESFIRIGLGVKTLLENY